ncbi:uncharacterized protein LOC110838162 [Zootermopsis nevadensis]|uniref:uncharacterized protein LOC110838162 n=1 Tax=Zootermopsis nevadensis TaxID=136037 RepID=UPI000B8E35BE|nr:uncharacterized protein LOC110838162 [Zootermopsis nevadensis]
MLMWWQGDPLLCAMGRQGCCGYTTGRKSTCDELAKWCRAPLLGLYPTSGAKHRLNAPFPLPSHSDHPVLRRAETAAEMLLHPQGCVTSRDCTPWKHCQMHLKRHQHRQFSNKI